MKIRQATLWLQIFVLAASAAWAQSNTGSIAGTVTDPNGAAVPGAKVKAVQNETKAEIEVLTTDAGIFAMPSLSVGTYVVTVEKVGFKKITQSNIEIRIAQRQVLDLKLEVGDVQQSVEVTATAQLLESTTSDRGTAVSQKMMNTLPLFTGGVRSPAAFVGYMPGVNAGAELSISGSGGRAQEILLDGASATIPESGGVVFNFQSSEQFGEFKLLTNSYGAEYGRFGGGVEIFVSRSGGNDLHGGAFLNMRRDIWNANSWANNRTGAKRPKERFNEVGGVIGGPIWIPKLYDGRNKTFWFFTTTRDLRPATATPVLSTLPIAAYKAGNFSSSPQAIYDPASGTTTRTPFGGGVIPTNRFSKVSAAILPLIPDPTRSSTTQNYDFVNTSALTDNHWSLKFDHNITANNRVSYYMSRQNQDIQGNASFPGPIGTGLGSSYQRPESYRVNHDYVISPTILLHTTYGFTRQQQGWDNPAQKGWGSKIGLPLTGLADAFPRVLFENSRDLLSPWGVQDGKVSNGTQFNWTTHLNQALSIVKGKHNWKIGWDLRRLRTFSDPVDLAGSNGRYFFNTFQTGLPGSLGTTGHPFASFLLGTTNSADTTSLPVLAGQIRYGYHAVYLMDDWKVSSRLTLNLGMRYDVPIGWHEKNGDASFVDLKAINPITGTPGALAFTGFGPGRIGAKRAYPTDWTNLGPRLGFAYRLFDKTVLRGGWGVFYQTLGNGGCGCRNGFAGPAVQRASDGLNAALQWDGGIPLPPGFAAPPFVGNGGFANNQSVDVFTQTFGNAPRNQNWSIGVQHETKGFLFDVAYVGNRANKLSSTTDLNANPTSVLALGSLLTQSITAPAVVAAGYKPPYAGFTGSLAQALRPYPQYLSVWGRNSGVGRSWYDALQMKAERRFGSLQMMGSYTWSKSLSVAHFRQIFSQNFSVGAQAQDYFNFNDMKSFLPFHQPHVANFLASYDLPIGRGKKFLNVGNRWADALVGGWNIALAARYYTPALTPITSPVNDLASTTFATTKKANRINSVPIRTNMGRGDMTTLLNTFLTPVALRNNPATYFNPGAFAAAPALQLGSAALFYNDLRNPNIYIENIAMSKRFKVPITADRTVDLIYRADAFNAFNRTNFGGINGSIGNANFGLPSGPMTGARLITMGLRLDF